MIQLSELASRLGAKAEWLQAGGDGDVLVSNLSLPVNAGIDSVSFAYSAPAVATRPLLAAAVLTTEKLRKNYPNGLIVDDLLLALARARYWLPTRESKLDEQPRSANPAVCQAYKAANSALVHDSACLEGQVSIANTSMIGAYTYISGDVRIGDYCSIGSNVTITGPASIGNRVTVGANTTIGANPFLYVQDNRRWLRVPDFCGVNIADDVDIGDGCTIDRGMTADTRIGAGVKIDNQVHLGHGAEIGDDSIIAGGTTIAGEVVIGENCRIGGATAINEGVTICDGTTVLGMSAVTRSLTDRGEYTSVWPVEKRIMWWRQLAALKKLVKRN